MKNANNIKTFIFFDCKTTGHPHLENNKTRITELSLVAVQSSNIALGEYPRVMNKLSLCVNPGKLVSSDSTDLTGLCNFSLENQSFFDTTVVKTIQNFINTNKKPVCLVAHKGFEFYFPILKAEILKTGNCLTDDLLCTDSFLHFKQLNHAGQRNKQPNYVIEKVTIENDDGTEETFYIESEPKKRKVCNKQIKNGNNPIDKVIIKNDDGTEQVFYIEHQNKHQTSQQKKKKLVQRRRKTYCLDPENIETSIETVSAIANIINCNCRGNFKLVDAYSRNTNIEPKEAQEDVLVLIQCVATLGEKFVDWANKNYILFKDIEPMTPGKKLAPNKKFKFL